MSYRANQSAQAAHSSLLSSIAAMDSAKHNAVLWFADILARKLYRELGYSSMQQYSTEALSFSRTRFFDFNQLAQKLDQLPAVKAQVASGELGYTKARELIKVASPQTEDQWLKAASELSRQELEQKVARVKKKAAQRKKSAQVELLPSPPEARLAAAVPVRVGVSMTAEQAARYEALWQQLGTSPNAEDLLEAMAVLVEERGTSKSASGSKNDSCAPESPRGNNRPTTQIHIHQCPDCGATEANHRPLDRPDRERLTCDSAIAVPGGRNTTTIPPKTRREVLARDRHRCQAPGCTHTRFLEVHHRKPRHLGGTNKAENLITLCAACHRLWHERQPMPQAQGLNPSPIT